MLVFGEGGKPENPEKNPRSREENQQKLNPLMASGPGIEPGPHWWEASALTTTPSLLPYSLIAATLKSSRIYTSMDPVCAKLQDFLQSGYLSRERIFYKLIKNAVDFVTAVHNDFSKENRFEWDSESLEFLNSVEHYGHEATVNFYLVVLAFTNGQLIMQSKLLLHPNSTGSLPSAYFKRY